jgi:hypothetical protein
VIAASPRGLLVADAACARRLGVSIFDIADWTLRDA